ncbi:MAG: calcium/sodium antiporter [Phycisphaeraceae bacterium]|nr:calcium/sodium antiporter [Phycisphaeraceae bacterium]
MPVNNRLSDDLQALLAEARGGGMTIGQVEAALRGRGLAAVILLLALPFLFPVAIPLLSTVFGAAIGLLGLRLAMGMKSWLPGVIRRRPISPRALEKIVHGGTRIALRLEKLLRPRWSWTFLPGVRSLIGLSIMVAAMILSLPLPIPFTNTIPAIAIILVAMGSMERDGLAVLIGQAIHVGAWFYLYFVWDQVVKAATQVYQSSWFWEVMSVLDPMTWLMLLGGLAVLILGAELLVRGSSRLAASLGISPLVIGLTIVAFGTSSPELAVSVKAGLSGQPDIALGNVVGSNIFNVLLVLGLSAVVAPLVVSLQLIRWDVPIMVGASVLMGLMALDGRIGKIDGAILTVGIVGYTVLAIYLAKRQKNPAVQEEYDHEFAVGRGASVGRRVLLGVMCLAGLGALMLGTRWFVGGATTLATAMGVSELVIGLTIVAAGTSMPEVFTSLVATVRGERDIAVGNVVGSSIFNLLAILGISSLVTPGGLIVSDHLLWVDLPIMIVAAAGCLPIFFTGHRIARWEGVIFLGYYVAYTFYLVLRSAEGQDQLLAVFREGMFYFVMPLTVLTITVSVYRAVRERSAAGAFEG